jgi:hypothetical protein
MLLKTFLAIFVLAGAAPLAWGQLGVGLKLGVPASDAYKLLPLPAFSPFNAKAQPFTFGPYVELRLPANMAIEVDALRRSHEFLTAAGMETASSWEFPVLLKHRIGSRLIRPYFEGGVTLSRLSDVTVVNLKNRGNYGLVVGGGFEIKLLFLRLAPELRYSAYAFRTLDQPEVQSRRGQLAVLFGIGF